MGNIWLNHFPAIFPSKVASTMVLVTSFVIECMLLHDDACPHRGLGIEWTLFLETDDAMMSMLFSIASMISTSNNDGNKF